MERLGGKKSPGKGMDHSKTDPKKYKQKTKKPSEQTRGGGTLKNSKPDEKCTPKRS